MLYRVAKNSLPICLKIKSSCSSIVLFCFINICVYMQIYVILTFKLCTLNVQWLPSERVYYWRRSETLEPTVLQSCGLLSISAKASSMNYFRLSSDLGSDWWESALKTWFCWLMRSWSIWIEAVMSQRNCVMHEKHQSWFPVPTLKLGHGTWRILTRSSNHWNQSFHFHHCHWSVFIQCHQISVYNGECFLLVYNAV
jgi:hypothetical protein